MDVLQASGQCIPRMQPGVQFTVGRFVAHEEPVGPCFLQLGKG